jgi:Tyrosine phosphatase family
MDGTMVGRSPAAISSTSARIGAERATNLRDAEAAAGQPGNLDPASQRRRRTVRALVLVALLVGIATSALSFWILVLRDRYVPKRFGVVVPFKVFRSGQISRFLIEDVVTKNGIGTIIDLNGLEPGNADQQAEMDVAQANGIRHLRFPLRGNGTGDIERYAGAVAAMVESEREGRPVLVHCAAGSQRTGACVSFYRLLVRGDPPESVYRELVSYAWDPRSDKILLDYVNGHMHDMAQLLVQRHIIDREPDPLPVLHP